MRYYVVRKDDFIKLCENLDDTAKVTTEKLIDDIIFIEGQLEELRKYPLIQVNPKNPTQQKRTESAKLYKELLQQYNNCIKIMLGVFGDKEAAETSPLREYLQKLRSRE